MLNLRYLCSLPVSIFFTFSNYILTVLLLRSLKILSKIIICEVNLSLENLGGIVIKAPKNWVGTFSENTHSNACNSLILESGWDFISERFTSSSQNVITFHLYSKLFSLQILFALWWKLGSIAWSIYLDICIYNNTEWYLKHMVLFNINIKIDWWENLFNSDILR